MNSRCWLEIFSVNLCIINWGWDATGYVEWTEDESTSVPDAASEVSPLAKLMLVVVRAGPWKG